MSHRPEKALDALRASSSEDERGRLARYGIPDDDAMGVATRDIIALGKKFGTDHDLAIALWETGNYEARSLAAFVGDAKALTGAEMDAWASDFDNWAICDTVCFRLFDRSVLAWTKVDQWCVDDRTRVSKEVVDPNQWHGTANHGNSVRSN
ncbi:MAG: DNA alkylation repair protein [Rhodobacteraceae bacterium]|nr:DNA alkylation repair protein [Paracoccaceae bacterium]